MTDRLIVNRRQFAATCTAGLAAASVSCTAIHSRLPVSGLSSPSFADRMNPSISSFLVHVSSSESREIHAFRMDAQTGSLDLIEAITLPGTGAPTRGNIPMTWSVDRKLLYAQVRVEPFPLSAYALQPSTGRLRRVETMEFPAPMAYLSPTRNGRFLMGASYDAGLLFVNRIKADGRIASPALQTLQTPPKAHCIVEAPFGGLVYATSVDGDVIMAYRLDEFSGRLEPMSDTQTRPHAGPRHLVFHPSLDMLYCVNEHAGSLAVYRIDRVTGALQEVQHESLMPPGHVGNALGSDIHFRPDGQFLYACVRTTNAVTQFQVDATTGRVAKVGECEAELYPRGFAITPDGRFLLCAGQRSGHVSVYAIDPATGSLSLTGRQAVGKMPSWIEIIPAPAELRL